MAYDFTYIKIMIWMYELVIDVKQIGDHVYCQ